MNDEQTRVYVGTRKRNGKKPSYHLRWIGATTDKWKSELIGTARKEAEQLAALRQREISAGTTHGTEFRQHVFRISCGRLAGDVCNVLGNECVP